MQPTPHKHIFLFFILAVFLLEAVFFFSANYKSNQAIIAEEERVARIQSLLEGAAIGAKAVAVYDETLQKEIYGLNDDVMLPIASLTKIMTVATALNVFDDSKIISISSGAIKQDTDYGFFVGEKFKIGDLAKFILVGSANDGAYALAESDSFFLERINEKAQKIGMEKSLFFNPTGLDESDKLAGGYASAKDVNVMVRYALKAHPEIFDASVMPEIKIMSESGLEHKIKNTNEILGKIPNLLFSKTGFTPLAGGSLAIIYRDKQGHDIAITVLGSTMPGRFSDMEKIIYILDN